MKAAKVTSHYDIFEAREAEEKLDHAVGVRSDGARGDSLLPQSHTDTILGEKAHSADTTIHSFISRASLRCRKKKRNQNHTAISVPVPMKTWQPSSGCTAVEEKPL